MTEKYGDIAQLARATGSYPVCRWFKSDYRYQERSVLISADLFGPVVKRLRHRPFTAVTRVRFSSGSPQSICNSRCFFICKVKFFDNRESNSQLVHLSAVRQGRSRKGQKIGYLRSKSTRQSLGDSRPGHHKASETSRCFFICFKTI